MAPNRPRKKGYFAVAKFLRMSPRKIRPIANHVRKKPYTEALGILDMLPHKGARLIKKVVRSAAANALYHNENLDEEMLYIRTLEIDDGPRMKRVWPRGRGRADRLQKRLCHISVELDEISAAKKG